MIRMRYNGNGQPLREKIFQLLAKSQTSAEENLNALLQCASHIRNRIIVEQTAGECGLKVSGFRCNDSLELYYDLRDGRHDVGYISKGWDDPGFRVGDIVNVPKRNILRVKEHVYRLLRFCATRGMVLTIEQSRDSIALQLDAVIYLEGFNAKVLQQVLCSLLSCVEKAEEAIG